VASPRAIDSASRRPFVILSNALLLIPEIRNPKTLQNKIQSHPQTADAQKVDFPNRLPSLNPSVRSISVPMAAIVPAVPVPVVVNKTCSGVDRRAPEGATPDPADHTSDHQADGTS
jgi:hypothetical protein